MVTADQLATLARCYCEATGTAPSALGKRAVQNNRVFARLLAGQGCRLHTAERVFDWFSINWPDGLGWPEGVPRPVSAIRPGGLGEAGAGGLAPGETPGRDCGA